jgi:hypothetical protein
VAALGFLAQALQRVVGIAVERMHQDSLGLVDHRPRDHGVLELAGGALRLIVGRRVREHRAAERGEHVSHRIGLGVQHAGTHPEQGQDQGATRKLAHEVNRAADATPQRRLGEFRPAGFVERVRAADRDTGVRSLDQRAATDPELQVSELRQVRMGRRGTDHFTLAPDRGMRSRARRHLPGSELRELVQRPGLSAVGEAQ